MSGASSLPALVRPRPLFLLAITLQITIFVIARRDVPADDALGYTESAFWMGSSPPGTHPFAMRVGITLPLAALFRTVGVSAWTVNLPCLLATLAILLTTYLAAPTDRARRIGLGLATTASAFVLYGTELNADLLCGAATGVSLYLLVRGRLAAAVAVWFVAFLVKETTIYFAPAWLYAIALEVRAAGWRTAARRFAPAFVVGTGLVALYLVACARIWGDPFARVAGINALAEAHLWAPHGEPARWWAERLIWGPPLVYLATFGVALVLAVAGARRVDGRERIWLVALVSYLLFHWFGSASTTQYVPLPLSQRRMLMEVLPCVLVAATLASERFAWRRWQVAIACALAVVPFGWTLARAVRRERPETALHARIHAEVAATTHPVLVVCPDFRCVAAVPFEFGYRMPANLQLVSTVDYAAAPPPAPGTQVRVVVRPHTKIAVFGDRSIVAPVEALDLPRLYWHAKARLYDAGDGARLHGVLHALYTP